MTDMLHPLDDACSEAILVPFHEPARSRQLTLQITTSADCTVQYLSRWADTHLHIRSGQSDAWAEVAVDVDAPLDGYDTLILTARVAPGPRVALSAMVDGQLQQAEEATALAEGRRLELKLPLAGKHIEQVRVRFDLSEPVAYNCDLCWVALAASDLRQRIERQPWPIDRTWPHQIDPDAAWDQPTFRRGLFFDHTDLPRLREKCLSQPWSPLFEQVRQRADAAMQREPEDDLGLYQPWSDRRYNRSRHPARPFFHESLDLCFAGLILEDEAMLRHAARYLMCLVHTKYWCQSEESRAVGLSWDQRCFIEEMSATAVAILLDWLGFALTPAGRVVAEQALWDRGLSIIERDVMKHDYLHRNNQGPWFGRARILGGLVLETHWPHVDDYADRAMRKMIHGLDHYVLEDGGTDEGVGYLAMTMHTALIGLFAYARARDTTVRVLLPDQFDQMDRYLRVMSATEPGRVLLSADNSCDEMLGDGATLLAGLYPGQCFDRFLARQLEPEPDTYYRQYMQRGIFSLIFGPESVPEPSCVVPAFDLLPATGFATSMRTDENGRSLRLHVSGCRAKPSHAHPDQGSVVVECDGEPMFIDRGVVRYDDARLWRMKPSAAHNVLTPIDQDGNYPDQVLPKDHPIIPDASGDAERFAATIDLAPVWPDHAEHYQRRVTSTDIDQFEIHDAGKWRHPMGCAFHLQALKPFTLDGLRVIFEHAGSRWRIEADWATDVLQEQNGIDFAYRPVHHLILWGRPTKSFDLTTRFIREA